MLKWLITLMLAVLVIGMVRPRAGWLGRLPGDLRIRRGQREFYFPFASVVLLSLALTLIVHLLGR